MPNNILRILTIKLKYSISVNFQECFRNVYYEFNYISIENIQCGFEVIVGRYL